MCISYCSHCNGIKYPYTKDRDQSCKCMPMDYNNDIFSEDYKEFHLGKGYRSFSFCMSPDIIFSWKSPYPPGRIQIN